MECLNFNNLAVHTYYIIFRFNYENRSVSLFNVFHILTFIPSGMVSLPAKQAVTPRRTMTRTFMLRSEAVMDTMYNNSGTDTNTITNDTSLLYDGASVKAEKKSPPFFCCF